jgi:hypothetical protein
MTMRAGIGRRSSAAEPRTTTTMMATLPPENAF